MGYLDGTITSSTCTHVAECEHTFLILTKRAKRMMKYLQNIQRGVSKISNYNAQWPWSNLWLGVSVEDKKTADERIPLLLQTTAALQFVSYEPALGPVDFKKYFTTCRWIDWIIMGGETGPGARPMDPGWARSVRDQCKAAGVAFWFKSWGEYIREDILTEKINDFKYTIIENQPRYWKVGAKRASRLLDGREYSEMPAERDNPNA